MIAGRLSAVLLAATLSVALPAVHGQQPNPIPGTFTNVYPAADKANGDVQQALSLAAQQHKRVILDFGTNKCTECQVLAEFWRESHNQAQVAERFYVVHVNVGPKGNQNRSIAQRFHANVKAGVPVLVVVGEDGNVVEVSNEFRRAHNESPNDLTVFLNKARG